MKKIAVTFPGIGYHTDKPLLYYAKKLALTHGYEIKDVPYGGFAPDIKGNKAKMEEAFLSALDQAKILLKDIDWPCYDQILFISKSIGTAIAAAYAGQMQLTTLNIFFTPVEASFSFMKDPGIVFTGTKDPWLMYDTFLACIKKTTYPYEIIDRGNHSLETGDVLYDLASLSRIMAKVDTFMSSVVI